MSNAINELKKLLAEAAEAQKKLTEDTKEDVQYTKWNSCSLCGG